MSNDAVRAALAELVAMQDELGKAYHSTPGEYLFSDMVKLKDRCNAAWAAARSALSASTQPEEVDWKAAHAEEARKFQNETLRTSELSRLLTRFVQEHIDEHDPGPWSRGCNLCALVGEAKALLRKPVNEVATPPDRAAASAEEVDQAIGEAEDLRHEVAALQARIDTLMAAQAGREEVAPTAAPPVAQPVGEPVAPISEAEKIAQKARTYLTLHHTNPSDHLYAEIDAAILALSLLAVVPFERAEDAFERGRQQGMEQERALHELTALSQEMGGWQKPGVPAVPQEPSGWKLVPLEATPDMKRAADYYATLAEHRPKGMWYWDFLYRAMLAAAPPAQPAALTSAADMGVNYKRKD